ncbi:unnamed protein product, partial [Ectocarpus fasciculatus]
MADVLFGRPTEPASAPRVRAFAELALKEILSVEGSDASLLADKLAFSEYMDKINESVLLGLHEPPPAAPTINSAENECEQEEQDSSSDQTAKHSYHEAPSPLLHSFSVNATEADTVVRPLEASSWRAVSSLRRHHRPIGTNSALRRSAILSPPSSPCGARLHKVRFDVGDREEDLCTGTKMFPISAAQQNHNHGVGDDAQEPGLNGLERDLESTREAPAPSCDFDGPNLLQELRRLRSKAVAVVNTDGLGSPIHPSQEEAPGRHMPPSKSELPSPAADADNGREWESPIPSPPPSVSLPCGEDQTTSARGPTFCRRREHGTFMQAVPEGVHDTVGCPGHDRRSKRGFITIKDGLAGEAMVEWSDGSTGSSTQATAQSFRDGKHVLEARTSDYRRGPVDATRRAAANGFAGDQDRHYGSEGNGRDVPKQRSGCSDGTGGGCAKGREEKDEEELSLDLSDCSNE